MPEPARAGGPLRRAAAVAAVNVAVLAGLLAAVEGAARLAGPETAPAYTDAALYADSAFVAADGASGGPRPGAEGRSNGALLRVDADGFWRYAATDAPGGTPAAGAPDTAATWLWLGDSVTMGIGVVPDSSFAGRLAAAAPLRVRNGALIGYAAADYRRALEARLAEPGLRVARVSVGWCLNDLYGRGATPGPDATLRRTAGGALDLLRAHSHAYRWLKGALLDRPLRYYAHDRALYADEAALAAARTELAAMRDAAARHGVPLEVVLLPYEAQLRPAGASSGAGSLAGDRHPQAVMRRLLAELGIPAVDLAAPLARAARTAGGSAALYLYGDGIHLSARGHAAVAEALLGRGEARGAAAAREARFARDSTAGADQPARPARRLGLP